ncbi:hypothetical protein OIO90_005324 [Microbotryomycetes sp. JL221]|nr:hypothetical protein OIO90_005324 [Microbotryomycetes sp. JL221]
MKWLLRPWLKQGTASLIDLNYDDATNKAAVWQYDVIRLCESLAMPNSKWVSHFDVDEFVKVDALASSPVVPALHASPLGSLWRFPLHDRLASLERANCVPMSRITFVNVGHHDLDNDELVTQTHVNRHKAQLSYATYGKMWLHSKFEKSRAAWHGPHSCRPAPRDDLRPNVVVDSLGTTLDPEDDVYPSEGLPLTADGIVLNHYLQRSVKDCLDKFETNKQASRNWRTIDGKVGCARSYIPTDEELSSPERRRELFGRAFGKELASRADDWDQNLLIDTRARDEWVGRMTNWVLHQWLDDKGLWRWLAQTNKHHKLEGVDNMLSLDL